jgi:hypothetical protein
MKLRLQEAVMTREASTGALVGIVGKTDKGQHFEMSRVVVPLEEDLIDLNPEAVVRVRYEWEVSVDIEGPQYYTLPRTKPKKRSRKI